jgi:uncharacterized protein YbjT (DUF2867 family)
VIGNCRLYYAQSIKDGLVQMLFGESKHAPIAAEDQARLMVSILENPSAHKGKTYELFGPKEYFRTIWLLRTVTFIPKGIVRPDDLSPTHRI